MAEQARALGRDAGRRVTDQTTADVEETLRSAMVDAAAGAALSTGLLTDTFSATGLEPVDLSRVVALGAPAAAPAAAASEGSAASTGGGEAPDPAHQRKVAKAEQAVADAGSALQEARQRVEQAQEQAARAQRLRERLEAERQEVQRRLDDPRC